MERERAEKEFPHWAFSPDAGKPKEDKLQFVFTEWFDNFKRKNTVTIVGAAALLVWTLTTCGITGSIVRHNTEEEVTDELTHFWRGQMQIKQERIYILEDIVMKMNVGDTLTEEERTVLREVTGEGILTGAESRQSAIKTDAEAMARAFEGIKGITEREDDLRTYGWNMCFRASSKDYPSTIVGVVSQKNQYMGYSDQNPVVSKKYDIALEVVTDYYNGNWPETDRYVYAEWDNSGKIILRDEYNSGRSTSYWWWGK